MGNKTKYTITIIGLSSFIKTKDKIKALRKNAGKNSNNAPYKNDNKTNKCT